MKNFIVTLVAVFAMISFTANARTVKDIDTYNAQACGEYLMKHQKDTIVNIFSLGKGGIKVVRSVFMGCEENILHAHMDTIWGSQLDKLSLSEKESLLRGKSKYFTPQCHHSKQAIDTVSSIVSSDIVLRTAKKYGRNLSAGDIGYHFDFWKEMLYFEIREKHLAELKAKAVKEQTEKENILFCGGYLLLIAAGSVCGARIAKRNNQ